jgi:hypothetical protein
MHLRFLCSATVAALSAIAPYCSALTITQTETVVVSNSSTSGSPSLSLFAPWIFQPFDPNLGTLTSVQFNASVTGTAAVSETNSFGQSLPPFEWRGSISISHNFIVVAPGLTSITNIPPENFTGPTHLLGPGETAVFRVDYSQFGSATYTSPTDLAAFVGPSLLHHASSHGQGFGPSFFGGFNATESVAFTLIYNYTPAAAVPERGATAAMFGAAAVGSILIHLRRRQH